jgi:glycosyltransferase involved in cell wall biosynthesis
LRIGLIIYGSLDTISGGYLYDRMLVEHLRRQGDYVEIISLPYQSYGQHLGHNFWAGLFRRVREARLDILLQDELNHPSLFLFNRRLKKQTNLPILTIVHHMRHLEDRSAWENRLYRWIERLYLARIDGFIYNSQTTRATVEALAGTGKKSLVAYPGGNRLHNTITFEQISVRAQKPGPLQIIFLGNLIERKRLHILLEALTNLPLKSWNLDVVGSLTVDPTYVEFIRQQIIRSSLKEKINLAGNLSNADLAIRLTHSDVLIVPSSYEGFGIVYLEGMGFGLPAIASTAGAAREIISHGENGFLLPPDDPRTLAHHIRILNEDRTCLLQMSIAARQHYESHPTWRESTERIRQFLQRFAH